MADRPQILQIRKDIRRAQTYRTCRGQYLKFSTRGRQLTRPLLFERIVLVNHFEDARRRGPAPAVSSLQRLGGISRLFFGANALSISSLARPSARGRLAAVPDLPRPSISIDHFHFPPMPRMMLYGLPRCSILPIVLRATRLKADLAQRSCLLAAQRGGCACMDTSGLGSNPCIADTARAHAPASASVAG
jgi:hypothetical protein